MVNRRYFPATIFVEAIFRKISMNIVLIEYPWYSIYKGEVDDDIILQNTEIVYDFIKKILTWMIKIYLYLEDISRLPPQMI